MDPRDTSWTLIDAAAGGDLPSREQFARIYGPVIKAYLAARWTGTRRASEIDDAAQDVFVECFRRGGVLQRAERERGGGFRAFLFGVVRNVALRCEARQQRGVPAVPISALEEQAADQTRSSQIFDRAWATAILRQVALQMESAAAVGGAEAQRRVELLRLRFHEGLAIREVAQRWGVDAAQLHHQYSRARAEFRLALLAVLRTLHADRDADLEAEAVQLLAILAD